MSHYDGHCRDLPQEEINAKLAAGVPYVIRQKIPAEGVTGFDDVVYGHIEVNNSELDDQILIKTDGMPTYNFANVVDDHLMGITHVIRGSEYLSSTPKYNLLYQAFGWEVPTYIHCPPVMKDAQHKLSKAQRRCQLSGPGGKGLSARRCAELSAAAGLGTGRRTGNLQP